MYRHRAVTYLIKFWCLSPLAAKCHLFDFSLCLSVSVSLSVLISCLALLCYVIGPNTFIHQPINTTHIHKDIPHQSYILTQRQQEVNWQLHWVKLEKRPQSPSPWWHTSSNKTAPTPTRPHLLVVPLSLGAIFFQTTTHVWTWVKFKGREAVWSSLVKSALWAVTVMDRGPGEPWAYTWLL